MANMATLWLSRLFISLACFALTACAFSPGITLSDARGSGGNDKLDMGVVSPITPDLIRMHHAKLATDVGQDVKRLFGVAKPYVIGPGDVLNIIIWDHPELNLIAAASSLTTDTASLSSVGNGYNVSPDGFIQFPLAGRLKLGGLTESQARQELATRLGRFIKNPDVTVRIQAYRSGRVYVEGEVRLPGLQAVNDIPMTLPEAIGRAGGFSAAADRTTVSVTRNGSTTLINLPLLAQLEVNPGKILLAGGDIVRVFSREDSKVYVLGEVLRPSALPLLNGRMTLSQALGESGGVSQISGDPRQIFVLRNGGSGNAEIYHLDANTPAAYALAEGFELKARDVVFVDPTSLVRWNRVISLLLPSAQISESTRNATIK